MNLIFKSNKTEEMSRIYDELSSSSFCDVSQRKLAVTSEPILLIQNINHYKILLDHNVDNFLSMLSSLS